MQIFKTRGKIDVKVELLKTYFGDLVDDKLIAIVKKCDITTDTYKIGNKTFIGVEHFLGFDCTKIGANRMTIHDAINQLKSDVQYFADVMDYSLDDAYERYVDRVSLMGVNSLYINSSKRWVI